MKQFLIFIVAIFIVFDVGKGWSTGLKQMAFMIGVLAASLWASFFHPFWGLLPYYLFSILQPQSLWNWALPPGVRWSFYAACIALLAVVINFHKVMRRMRMTTVVPLLLAYAALITLSYLLAFDSHTAAFWFDLIIKTLIMAILVALLTDSIERARMMILMITFSLGYLAWHFNILYLTEHRMDLLFYGLGALDNNGVAMIMAMGIPLMYAVGISVRALWMKLACAWLGVFLVHSIMLAYSRGAMLSAGMVGLWILWRHRPRYQIALLAPAIVIVVLMLAGPAVRARFASINEGGIDASIQARYDSWAGALEMISDHPLVGMGLRNSNIFSHNYGADVAGRTIHNLYLQIAADSGVPALMVYLMIAGLALYSAGRGRKMLLEWNEDHESERHPIPLNPATQTPACTAEELAETLHQNRWHANLLAGVQASLLIFLVDSFFFSSEILEVAWLLMVIACISPRLVTEHLHKLDEVYHPEIDTPPETAIRPQRQPLPMPEDRPAARPRLLPSPFSGNLPRTQP